MNFRVTSGGGSVFAGAAITTADGLAKERWTLGTSVADDQRVEARAVDPNTGAPIVFATFRATARADVPAALVKVAGLAATSWSLGSVIGEQSVTAASGSLSLNWLAFDIRCDGHGSGAIRTYDDAQRGRPQRRGMV